MRRNRLLVITGRCLSSAAAAIGAFLLIGAAVEVGEGWFHQWSGRRELSSAPRADPQLHRLAQPLSPARERRPERGEPLATLHIPRLDMSVVVLEGSDNYVLKKGPGHIEDTAYPGEPGNVAIAGHRDTHFRPLRNIRLNDEVILRTKTTALRYFINSVDVIDPTEMQVLDPTPGPALTLVTCYPFDFVGNAPRRFVIRATPRVAVGAAEKHAEP